MRAPEPLIIQRREPSLEPENVVVPRLEAVTGHEFVQFWSAFYPVKYDQRYCDHLKLGQALSRSDIEELMAWKAGARFHKKAAEVASRVPLAPLNELRLQEAATPDDLRSFFDQTSVAVSSGIIWRIMILHIARPIDAPIYDKNSWLAWRFLSGAFKDSDLGLKPNNPNTYFRSYIPFAAQLQNATNHNLEENYFRKVDRSLYEFGRFLQSRAGRRLAQIH